MNNEINEEEIKRLAVGFLNGYISDIINNSEAKVDSPKYKHTVICVAIRQLHIDVFNKEFKEHGYRLETYLNINPDSPGSMVKGFTNTDTTPFYISDSGTFGIHDNPTEDNEKFLGMLDGFVETTGTARGNFLRTDHRNYERLPRDFSGLVHNSDLSWMEGVCLLPNMYNSGESTPTVSDWEETDYNSPIMSKYGNIIKKTYDEQREMRKKEAERREKEAERREKEGNRDNSDDNDPKGTGSGLGGFSSVGDSGPSGLSTSKPSDSHRNWINWETILYNVYLLLLGILDNWEILLNI